MILWFLLIVLALYLIVLIGVAYCFVFPFRTPLFISPGYLGVPQEQKEFVDQGTGKLLRSWWVPCDQPEVVMVCGHGYMMNRAELAPFAPRWKGRPVAFLFFDFPAHGSSQGKKCGFGYRERTAVVSAVGEAKTRYPNAKIVLVGSSMGAAASAIALSEDGGLADGLILDSCYDRLMDAVNGWWLFIGGPTVRFFLWPAAWIGMPLSGIDPRRIVISNYLKSVSTPCLILHGGADTLAPLKAATENHRALIGPKRIVVFEGRNHSEARWEEPERYFGEIEKFLCEHGFCSS